MKPTLILSLLFCLTTLINAQTFQFGTKTNPQGVTFEVDANGFIIGGKHMLPVMGEIHFSRVPAEEWQHELQKMKAGGITIVATYVFWSHHEYVQGQWDWTGNRNLHAFLQACKAEELPVILRLGPFCHGEVLMGGIPQWIVSKSQSDPSQFRLRSEAPGFIRCVEELYRNIYLQSADMLWKDGGPVVAVQLENECRGPWSYYMALKNMAVRIGFDTPFYTRTGWPKLNGSEEFGQMIPLYGDYADGFWDRTLNDMPGDYRKAFEMKNERMSQVIATETFTREELQSSASSASSSKIYPYLTCELGGGMMTSYHRRINMSGNEPFPLAICKLGSGSNMPGYYMYHGGTNPPPVVQPDGSLLTMAETQQSPVTNYNDMPYLTYDFQCPLGEMGQPNLTAFHQTRWLHLFLSQWGEQISQMPVDTLSTHYARRGCFEFYNDYVRILHEEGKAYVRPVQMPFRGHLITADAQPLCHIGNTLYLIPIKGLTPTITIDATTINLTPDKTIRHRDLRIRLLSVSEAERTYLIDGTIRRATHPGGILYKDHGVIREEYWQTITTPSVSAVKISEAGTPRTIPMGAQKVAAMPTDLDFTQAAVYKIELNRLNRYTSNGFLQINYQGDCARIYADGKLVEDNFWNGKPMLVRLSDLIGKQIELRILPLSKEAPIYLQQPQRNILLNAPTPYLLNLEDIKLMIRNVK